MLSVFLSLVKNHCLSLCLSSCLSLSLSLSLSLAVSLCLSVSLSVCLSVCLSAMASEPPAPCYSSRALLPAAVPFNLHIRSCVKIEHKSCTPYGGEMKPHLCLEKNESKPKQSFHSLLGIPDHYFSRFHWKSKGSGEHSALITLCQ